MQHYQIGQLLRKRYMTDQTFLNETYDRDEVCMNMKNINSLIYVLTVKIKSLI